MAKISILLLMLIFAVGSIPAVSAASLSVGTISYDSTVVKDESIVVTSSVTASSVSGILTVDVTLTDNSGLFNIPTPTQQLQFTTDGTKAISWTVTAISSGNSGTPFTISAAGDDGSSGSRTSSAVVTVKDRPIITVTKSTDKSSVTAGDTITVSYVVSNSASTGAADATNVNITLTYPSGWSLTNGNDSYMLGTIAPGTSKAGSWVVTADNPAETNTLILNVTSAIPGGTVSTTANISGPSSSSDSSSDSNRDSSSSGGGGGGTSGEDFENIMISETEREYVNNGSKVIYSFDIEGNIVQYINFTALTNSGQVAAKVEILNHTSALVDQAPPDIVYKNLNIWVGNLGWATSKNIANSTINFKVEMSWVYDNNIDKSTIKLNRYSDGKWNPLETTKIGEDADYLYFEAETPGFSPFAITGKKVSVSSPSDTPESSANAEPTNVMEESHDSTPTEKKPGIPGFSLFAGVSVLLMAMQILRKRK